MCQPRPPAQVIHRFSTGPSYPQVIHRVTKGNTGNTPAGNTGNTSVRAREVPSGRHQSLALTTQVLACPEFFSGNIHTKFFCVSLLTDQKHSGKVYSSQRMSLPDSGKPQRDPSQRLEGYGNEYGTEAIQSPRKPKSATRVRGCRG